jgi:hypothetical protein
MSRSVSRLLLVLQHSFFVCFISLLAVRGATTPGNWSTTPLTPPAVPLAVRSQFLSCWLGGANNSALSQSWPVANDGTRVCSFMYTWFYWIILTNLQRFWVGRVSLRLMGLFTNSLGMHWGPVYRHHQACLRRSSYRFRIRQHEVLLHWRQGRWTL